MRVFTGCGGEVYLASEPLPFEGLGLVDCGDGFEWRSGDIGRSHWLEEGLTFELRDDEGWWYLLDPESVEPAIGHVTFRRNLHGRSVRASGICLPLGLTARAQDWTLRIGFELVEKKTLEGIEYESVPTGTHAAIEGVVDASSYHQSEPGARVAVVLPQSAGGFFMAMGQITSRQNGSMNIEIDEKGVHYGIR